MANPFMHCRELVTGFPVVCASPGETFSWGRKIGEALTEPASICLDGPLGAGKTEFVKGLAEGLGVSGGVGSPTFSIINEHPEGRLPFWHADLYRLESESELFVLGLEECFSDGVVAIEWGQKFPEIFPKNTLYVRIEPVSDGRHLHFSIR